MISYQRSTHPTTVMVVIADFSPPNLSRQSETIMAITKLELALQFFAMVVCAAMAIGIPLEHQQRDIIFWKPSQHPLHHDSVAILANTEVPPEDVSCDISKLAQYLSTISSAVLTEFKTASPLSSVQRKLAIP